MSERDYDLWRLSFGLRVLTLRHERQAGRYEATDLELDAHAGELADMDVEHARWRMAIERVRLRAKAEGLQLKLATESEVAADADRCARMAPLYAKHRESLIAYVAGLWFARLWVSQSDAEVINGGAHGLARLTVEAYGDLRGGS